MHFPARYGTQFRPPARAFTPCSAWWRVPSRKGGLQVLRAFSPQKRALRQPREVEGLAKVFPCPAKARTGVPVLIQRHEAVSSPRRNPRQAGGGGFGERSASK